MKLNLYEEKNIQNEHVDVYYSNMRPIIRQIIDKINSERPKLRGRPADEDLNDGEEVLLDPKEIYYLDYIESDQHIQDPSVKAGSEHESVCIL